MNNIINQADIGNSSALSGYGKAALYILLASALPNFALANPQGGVISAGSATIQESAKKLDIHQYSNKAVIDWRTFDIEIDEHTEFHQPNSSSVALNRISQSSPSQIMGKLTANGNVVIVNPNGVLFGKNSTVDVNGITVTTADIDNNSFMQGDMKFDKAGNVDAKIINEGVITAKEAGLVGLVAPNVENHGIIKARLGKIHLASADKFTLDMYGDGLLEVEVSDDVKSQIISNTGLIEADGGIVNITAAAGRDVIDSLIDIKGNIRAQSVNNKNGKIVISAADTVKVSGKLDISGYGVGHNGGDVEILGNKVALTDNAIIDASGDKGGGSIKIGGNYQGKGNTKTARATYIGKDAKIKADAVTEGDGGEVIVWADNTTRYYGNISAKGAGEGNGGFVEVSGKEYLDFNGDVDLSGKLLGTLLLDPDDIEIVAGSATPAEFLDNNVLFAENNGNTSIIGANILSSRLSSNANIVLQANNSIVVNSAITSTGDGNLVLQTAAGGIITINNSIVMNTGDLKLIADEVDIAANISGSGNIVIRPATAGYILEIGSTDSSSLNLTAAEIDYLQNGWSSITLGSELATVINVTEAVTFKDDTKLNASHSGSEVYTSLVGKITTIDNADLTIRGNGGGILTPIYRPIFLNGDLDVSGDLNFFPSPDLIINSNLIEVGGNVLITGGNLTSLNANFDVGGNFTYNHNSTHDIRFESGNDFNIGGNLSLNTAGPVVMGANSSLNVDGSLTFISRGINFNPTAKVYGNSNGTSALTFREYGDDAAMELGGTSLGAIWQMTTAEIATLQNGFSSINFGSTSHAADIVFTADTIFADNVNLYQNLNTYDIDINIANKITIIDNANLSIYGARIHNVSANPDSLITISDGLDIAGDLYINGHSIALTGATGDEQFIVGGDFELLTSASHQSIFNNWNLVNIGGDMIFPSVRIQDIDILNIDGNYTSTWNGADMGIRDVGIINVGGDFTTYGNARMFLNSNDVNISGNLNMNSTGGAISPETAVVTHHSINLVGNINVGGDVTLTASHAGGSLGNFANLQANGDILINSSVITLLAGSTISGNADGSSNLVFREYGDNGVMELGGTSAAATWQLKAAEIETIQNGFNSLTFGSSAQSANIWVTDAVSFADDVFITQNNLAAARIDIEAPFTTTDNANLTLAGGNGTGIADGGTDIYTGVDITADLNIAGDFYTTARRRNDIRNFTNMIIGGDVTILKTIDNNSNDIRNISNLVVGGDIVKVNYLHTINNVDIAGDILSGWLLSRITTFDAGGDVMLTSGGIEGSGTYNIGGNLSMSRPNGPSGFSHGGNATINVGGDLFVNAGTEFSMSANKDLFVDGNIEIHSNSININAAGGSTISGNIDGSSNLIFRVGGDNAAMELGGTSHGATWQLTSAEIGALSNGFNSISFGSTSAPAHTQSIYITGATNFTDDVIFNLSSSTLDIKENLSTTDNASLTVNGNGVHADISMNGGDLNIAKDLILNIKLENNTASEINVAGNIAFNSNGTNTNSIRTLADLELNAGGNIHFAKHVYGAGNDIVSNAESFTFGAGYGWGDSFWPLGDISFTSVNSISLPEIIDVNSLFAQTTGVGSDITLAGNINAKAADTAVTLVSASDFINSGNHNISTTNGRWLIYSENPALNEKGGLNSEFNRYNCTYSGSCPSFASEIGDGFMYSYIPNLTITLDNASRSYGDANPTTIGYTISGWLDGVDQFSNTGGVINVASPATAMSSVGNYSLSQTSNSLVNDIGYSFDFVNGQLFVTKRDITAVISDSSRVYAAPNPLLGHDYIRFTNMANDEGNDVIDSLVFTFGGIRTSRVGTSHDIGLILSDNNYNLAGFTPGTLTITGSEASESFDKVISHYIVLTEKTLEPNDYLDLSTSSQNAIPTDNGSYKANEKIYDVSLKKEDNEPDKAIKLFSDLLEISPKLAKLFRL